VGTWIKNQRKEPRTLIELRRNPLGIYLFIYMKPPHSILYLKQLAQRSRKEY
jgi:hypothetical protein